MNEFLDIVLLFRCRKSRMRNVKHRIWMYLFRYVHCCVYHQDYVAELPVRKAAEVLAILS